AHLAFAMHRVTATARAELLDGKLLGLTFFVPAGIVVPPLAPVASKPDQFSNCCHLVSSHSNCKAHDGNRTRDLFLTKEVLCRLSYMGPQEHRWKLPICPHLRSTGAGNGTRTRDPELGRLALYQLSYSRSPHNQAIIWWRGEDSNLRRLRRQIYSLLPLAAREPLRATLPKPMARIELATY